MSALVRVEPQLFDGTAGTGIDAITLPMPTGDPDEMLRAPTPGNPSPPLVLRVAHRNVRRFYHNRAVFRVAGPYPDGTILVDSEAAVYALVLKALTQ
ncbi:unnamed protein product [marine sediment metagenome]|uniref:Uncharacterized protein n=1 Tax=marine sediment metagenome TaxID=412755 RepID=X0V276_9ZZZZ